MSTNHEHAARRADYASRLCDLTPGHWTHVDGVPVHASQDGAESPVAFGVGFASGGKIAAYTTELKLAVDWLVAAVDAREELCRAVELVRSAGFQVTRA